MFIGFQSFPLFFLHNSTKDPRTHCITTRGWRITLLLNLLKIVSFSKKVGSLLFDSLILNVLSQYQTWLKQTDPQYHQEDHK